ncbi:MAG: ATP-binding protein [Planctomycetota bacterium]
MDKRMINLLLVEDDPSACQFVKQALSDCSKIINFDVETTRDLSETIEILNCRDFDIILLDLELPDSRGIDTVIRIRAANPFISIIVMTEPDEEEIGIEAIKNGADDYLVKGKIFKDVLGRSIYYVIERKKEREQNSGELTRLIENLETSNKELKDFAYVVSHDLKAPLRAIKTLADWLSTDYADKIGQDGKEQIDLLLSRVDRMHNLIEGVLQYSRVGRIKQRPVNVNLNDLMSEIIETIGPDKNIRIEVKNQLPTIFFEQTRITQLFQNLLNNAVTHMDKSNGLIEVTCAEEDGYWKFAIADNGPGIKQKDFERIFQIFQTLLPRDQLESTGVGLTIVKKIVETYGGRIWVESQVGIGSTFHFTLPKIKQDTAEEAVLADSIEA